MVVLLTVTVDRPARATVAAQLMTRTPGADNGNLQALDHTVWAASGRNEFGCDWEVLSMKSRGTGTVHGVFALAQ